MNNVTPEKKQNVLKTLAIIGLFGVIIFIAWISIQIVSILPSALNSLASLANNVYNYNDEVVNEINLKPISESIPTGSELNINWERKLLTGIYTFKYECQDGLSIDVQTSESQFDSIGCDSSYNLGNVDGAQIVINSEKKPEVKVLYTISYFKTNDVTPTATKSQEVTVTNPRFDEMDNKNGTTTNKIAKENKTDLVNPDEEVVNIITPVEESKKVDAVVTSPKPSTATAPIYKYTYVAPISNPNGFTDLKVDYLGIGITDKSGKFINTGILVKDVAGAIQFSVHNIGTKTSENWYFTANLPGGIKYESNIQIPLKPNEKATLTIKFPAVDNTNLQTFEIDAKTTKDTNLKDNSIDWSVVVIK